MRVKGLLILTLILSFGCAKPVRQVAATPPQAPTQIPVVDEEPHEIPSDTPVLSARRGVLPNPAFDWPVDEARMTRGYFLKDPRKRSRRPHLGIDLAAPRGTPIYAAHDGTVIYVGREFKGFGRMVMIEGKEGWATLYAHLVKARVNEGQVVRQGDLIGDMGRTGRATGVHLHFEIRTKSGPVDPLNYLPHSPRFALNSKKVNKAN